MDTVFAKFSVGQIVRHKLFGYRGVIIDVDPEFRGTDEWYRKMAPEPAAEGQTLVLMHSTDNRTYVAEHNLELDDSGDPITHPDLSAYFIGLVEGTYVPRDCGN